MLARAWGRMDNGGETSTHLNTAGGIGFAHFPAFVKVFRQVFMFS